MMMRVSILFKSWRALTVQRRRSFLHNLCPPTTKAGVAEFNRDGSMRGRGGAEHCSEDIIDWWASRLRLSARSATGTELRPRGSAIMAMLGPVSWNSARELHSLLGIELALGPSSVSVSAKRCLAMESAVGEKALSSDCKSVEPGNRDGSVRGGEGAEHCPDDIVSVSWNSA